MTLSVAHLTTVHSWIDTRIFEKMCCSLAQNDYDVRLIAAHGPQPGRYVNGVTVELISTPSSRLQRLTSSAWQIYRRALAADADIYHFHDPELIPVGMLLRLRGRVVVFDVHEDMPKRVMDRQWIPRFLRRPASWLISATQQAANKSLSGIVSATPAIGRRFSPSKVVTVRNYPALEEFSSIECNWSDKSPTVVFVGTIDPTRGVLELIEGFSRMPAVSGAKLVIAGRRRGGEYEKALEEAAQGSPVTFPGFLNREQIASLLSEASVGAVTSLPCDTANEAISTKLFEYMAAGIPVVTAAMPAWAEIVDTAKCGTAVDPHNPDEIAAALHHWLSHPEASERAGRNGRDAVARKYNWNKEFSELELLYRRLAER